MVRLDTVRVRRHVRRHNELFVHVSPHSITVNWSVVTSTSSVAGMIKADALLYQSPHPLQVKVLLVTELVKTIEEKCTMEDKTMGEWK